MRRNLAKLLLGKMIDHAVKVMRVAFLESVDSFPELFGRGGLDLFSEPSGEGSLLLIDDLADEAGREPLDGALERCCQSNAKTSLLGGAEAPVEEAFQ